MQRNIVHVMAFCCQKTFISPEDAKMPGAKALPQGGHPDIERVRRAHLNDLENIPVFVLMAAVYMVVASPTLLNAKVVFYGFTAARFVHTVAYVGEIPQPARALGYFGGFVPTVYMAVKVLMTLLM